MPRRCTRALLASLVLAALVSLTAVLPGAALAATPTGAQVAALAAQTLLAIQTSPRYLALPPAQKRAVDRTAATAIQRLPAQFDALTPAQQASAVAAFQGAIAPLARSGVITPAQAAALTTAAQNLTNPPPTIASLVQDVYCTPFSGGCQGHHTVTAVFSGGTGVIDHGVGTVISGVPVELGCDIFCYEGTTLTLTVTNGAGVTATQTIFVPGMGLL